MPLTGFDIPAMAIELYIRHAALEVPHLDDFIVGTGGELHVGGREGQISNGVPVAFKHLTEWQDEM